MSDYIRAFDRGHPKAALVNMPTGSGKSAVITTMARCLITPGPVVVLTPRIGLREQLKRAWVVPNSLCSLIAC